MNREPIQPNNFASQLLWIIYLAGMLSTQPYGKDWNWAQSWRASLWPMVIAWNEVPPIIAGYAGRSALQEQGK